MDHNLSNFEREDPEPATRNDAPDLPAAHLRSMELTEQPELQEVARKVYVEEVEGSAGLKREWERIAGEDVSDGAFVEAYRAYVQDARTLYQTSPEQYAFLKEHVFYGKQYLDTWETYQIHEAIRSLSDIREIRPEVWEKLTISERMEVLQNIEIRLAHLQGRPSLSVVGHDMGIGLFGYFDGQELHVNTNSWAIDNVAESVDTIAHEGRHAYQHYAVSHPGFHHNPQEVAQWQWNMLPGNYMSAELYGQELYQNQPVEADAWQYGATIRQGLYHV